VLIGLLSLLAACGARATVETPWGAEAERYFETLGVALETDDVYTVLDFYAPGATVQDRTGDFQNTQVPVEEYLVSHRADLGRRLLGLHLGRSAAVALVAWPGSGRFGAVTTEMSESGVIARETVFVDVESLGRSLLASPEVAARYIELYHDYGRLWSADGALSVEALYAPDAVIRDALTGRVVRGRESTEPSGDPVTQLQALELAALDGETGSASGAALYLDPVSFGEDPGRAVGVFRAETDGCVHRVAVAWRLDDAGRIVDETRYPGVESFRTCSDAAPPNGWWSDRGLPEPREEIVTGVIATDNGREILVHNGTDRLMELIEWGLGRFAAAGLDRPRLDSVTFEPSRRCEGVGGRVVEGEETYGLVLCIDDGDLCAAEDACLLAPLAVRAALLHEMGHAWLRDEADDATRSRVLGVSGRNVWSDSGVPWVDRGVEYAAEVMAWGLVDEPIRLEQLDNPPCEELVAAFEVLTGRGPSLGAVACAD
jgi:hypothetical protein